MPRQTNLQRQLKEAKKQEDLRAQMERRRYTTVPRYHGHLPKVFPYRYNCSMEEVEVVVSQLQSQGVNGYAVTSHPRSTDGHVTVWLSVECSQVLLDLGVFSEEKLVASDRIDDGRQRPR